MSERNEIIEEARRYRELNTPELHDFTTAVPREAMHQRERWGTEHDGGKEAQDWFWLVGYLAGKALRSHLDGDTDKALHHTITVAAACANWHAAILGKTNMRPGIEPPDTAIRALAGTPAAVAPHQALAEWLETDEGKAALAEAHRKAEQTCAKLAEARRVTPEMMNTPIGAAVALEPVAQTQILTDALHKLSEAADDSDDARYGTLATYFVRDIARKALAEYDAALVERQQVEQQQERHAWDVTNSVSRDPSGNR